MSSSSSQFPLLHSIPLLDLVINYFSTSLKQLVKASHVSRHWRQAIKHYSDSTWSRLTTSSPASPLTTTVEVSSPSRSPCRCRSLHLQAQFIDCCRRGFVWIVQGLLRGAGNLIDVNLGVEKYAVNYGDDPTPLISACFACKLDVIKVLLAHGRKVLSEEEEGTTMIRVTSEFERIGSSLMFPASNPDQQQQELPDFSKSDKNNNNVVDVNKTSVNGMSPLLAVCSSNNTSKNVQAAEIVKLLLEDNAKIDDFEIESEKKKNTEQNEENSPIRSVKTSYPLVMACLLGKTEVAEAILKSGRIFNVSVIDPVFQQTPLAMARRGNKTEIVELLTNAGASE